MLSCRQPSITEFSASVLRFLSGEIGWQIGKVDIESRCLLRNLDPHCCHVRQVDPKHRGR